MPGTSANSRMGRSIAMNTCHRNFVIRRNNRATTPIRPPRAMSVLSVIRASIREGVLSSRGVSRGIFIVPIEPSTGSLRILRMTAQDDIVEKNHRVHRTTGRALRDLLTARDARSRYDRVRRRVHRGEEPHPADLHGQVVMLTLEAEGARHPATPSVQHVHYRAGNS